MVQLEREYGNLREKSGAAFQKRWSDSRLPRWISVAAISPSAVLLMALFVGGCRRPAPEPVTLGYFRLGWSQPDELPTAEPLSQRFTRETGIRLKNLPVPENTLDQLELSRKLMEGDGAGPDVVNVDMIWSGVLESDLVDLQPYSAAEVAAIAPQLIPSYRVDGKLVAIPYQVQVGTLEYRADLLREYGYAYPPRTWEELERMAERIQRGERRKGRKDFWGFVWQGADAEALTCNALEWQASEGGGRIVEDNRTISVNNPAAIRSWQRARRWIGRISPPSVVAFRELDSINAFDTGKAAFNRVWGGTTITRGGRNRQFHGRASPVEEKTGYTSMPAGLAGSAGTLGGSGLAVSRHSPHVPEAISLVEFLIRAQIHSNQAEDRAFEGPPRGSLDDPQPASPTTTKSMGEVVSRPSSVVGSKYDEVSRAYIAAVHSVLTGEREAPVAAAALENQLIKITGFRAGPPRSAE